MAGPNWVTRFDPWRLREVRAQRRLSQRQLAELVGQERVTIVAYESGRQTPRGPTLHAIAQALDVDVTDLLHPGPIDLPILRLRRNMSQTDVATALGVSQAWYNRIEARRARVARGQVRTIARLLQVDEDVIEKLVLVRGE